MEAGGVDSPKIHLRHQRDPCKRNPVSDVVGKNGGPNGRSGDTHSDHGVVDYVLSVVKIQETKVGDLSERDKGDDDQAEEKLPGERRAC